jgi:hypothetical protein
MSSGLVAIIITLLVLRRVFRERRKIAAREVPNFGPTLRDLSGVFGRLDTRLANMERRVTAPNYQLDREIRNLGA